MWVLKATEVSIIGITGAKIASNYRCHMQGQFYAFNKRHNNIVFLQS